MIGFNSKVQATYENTFNDKIVFDCREINAAVPKIYSSNPFYEVIEISTFEGAKSFRVFIETGRLAQFISSRSLGGVTLTGINLTPPHIGDVPIASGAGTQDLYFAVGGDEFNGRQGLAFQIGVERTTGKDQNFPDLICATISYIGTFRIAGGNLPPV